MLLMICMAGCFSRQPSVITGQEGKPLPNVNLLLMDSSTVVTQNNVPKGQAIVFFYFSPYCPYCRAETEEMVKNIHSLQNIKVYFVSSFPFSLIKSFYENYQLNKYRNITVAQDLGSSFGNYYKVPGVPYIAVYSGNKMLKQVFIGHTDYKTIEEVALN